MGVSPSNQRNILSVELYKFYSSEKLAALKSLKKISFLGLITFLLSTWYKMKIFRAGAGKVMLTTYIMKKKHKKSI